MLFGATSFAAAPFAGVGVINITVQPTGNQINVAVGAVEADLIIKVNGSRINLASSTVDMISWNPIPPGANQIWVPIDPDNP